MKLLETEAKSDLMSRNISEGSWMLLKPMLPRPVNDWVSLALDYDTYSFGERVILVQQSSQEARSQVSVKAEGLHGRVNIWCYGPISILWFPNAFMMAWDKNSIHEPAAILLFPIFIRKSAAAALTVHFSNMKLVEL